MKYKFLALSLLLAGSCAGDLTAQEKTDYYTPKWSDNIFVSVCGGIHAINNDGFNKLTPHFSVSVGKLNSTLIPNGLSMWKLAVLSHPAIQSFPHTSGDAEDAILQWRIDLPTSFEVKKK